MRSLLPGALLALGLLGCPHAIARDNGQFAQASPTDRDWVARLKSGKTPGSTCCSESDGNRPEGIWGTTADGYRVKIGDNWYDVPDDAVIREPNKLGRAIIWYSNQGGVVTIRCFLPGTLS